MGAFIAAQVLTRTLVGVAQTLGILAIAVALGAAVWRPQVEHSGKRSLQRSRS